MKDFLAQTFYGNTIENWFYSLLFIVGGIVLSKAIYWVFKTTVKAATAKTKTRLDDILIEILERPVVYFIILAGIYFGYKRLHFSPGVENFMNHAFTFVFIFNITWLLVRAANAIFSELVMPIAEKSDNNFDDQIVPLLRKVVKGLIWSLGIIVGLDNAGFDIMALIAGLGIGGLALALAAQDTVKNIFGGILIFVDKPFKLNDWVSIGDVSGHVKEVGIRSTRIRKLDGRLVTIPNAKFSESEIENITAEPTRRVLINLGLTYDTAPEKMELAMTILKDIVDKNQHNITDEHLISFNNWGDFNLGILFIYYIKKEADIFKTQTEINLQILKHFNKNGLEFAFPTQTIYKKELP